MKNKIKNIACFCVTLALITFGSAKLGYILRPVDVDSSINAIDTFHCMPENSFEVIGYGSSHTARCFNSMEFYHKYGIGAYNYGCNWQKINTILLFMKDSLRTQKPKIALVDTFLVGECKKNQNIDGEIYYTTAMSEFDGRREYLNWCFGNNLENYASYYMPLYAFHDNWTNICGDSFQKDVYYSYDYFKMMGFSASDVVNPVILPTEKSRQEELGGDSITILNEMVDLCENNDIKLIFFTAPWAGKNIYSDAMKSFAAENDCVYLDLFENINEMQIDGNCDYSDDGHLNTSGANKVSDFLGKYIIDNYEVTDFRQIEGNLWEKAENGQY